MERSDIGGIIPERSSENNPIHGQSLEKKRDRGWPASIPVLAA
jgi:hypothetical protein